MSRLVLLLDEIDQYVLLDGRGDLARAWLNRLETLRKTWIDRFSIGVAGGLGLLHLSHQLGSGLVSRAESIVARPFDLGELRQLLAPLVQRGLATDDSVLDTLAVLSGGNPALATYGCQRMWDAGEANARVLRDAFAGFPERHGDFVRAARDAVSRRGLVGAPGRVLGELHRFGRDFHGDEDLLPEQVFSSLLAVGLALLGWHEVDREPVQSAGFVDLKVRLAQPGIDGHIVLETKIWPRNDYATIQAQLDDYRVAATLGGVAVMIGGRRVEGWGDEYERKCLRDHSFTALPTPPNLVGHWRVEGTTRNGGPGRTDHLLVQIPKRK